MKNSLLKITFLEEQYIKEFAKIAQNAPDPWSYEDLYSSFENNGHFCYTAFYDNKPAAFACFFSLYECADLQMTVTAPHLRGIGIGNTFLQYCLEDLAKKNKSRCLLEVRLSNKNAISLYKKLGFKKLALRKNMYKQPNEDGILMAKELTV